jgi:hypothetical protein
VGSGFVVGAAGFGALNATGANFAALLVVVAVVLPRPRGHSSAVG